MGLQEWIFAHFLWIKAFHLIAVICWFAGLFYLPRLFVYHAMADDDISKERFQVMERKLYRGIMNPSMMVTILLGMALLFSNPEAYVKGAGWMHAKLTLVVLLIVYHVLCKKHMLALAENRNQKSHVYFRWFNEFPVLLLIAIVILVIVRPF